MLKKPYTLTLKKVVKAARKAYTENRLGAQHHTECLYDYRDYNMPDIGCAIGVALPKKVCDHIANEKLMSMGMQILIQDGILATSNEDELLLGQLQSSHDYWASGESALSAERDFIKKLEELENIVEERNRA